VAKVDPMGMEAVMLQGPFHPSVHQKAAYSRKGCSADVVRE
jgi:hypothetical protein